jgi:hypothetical protein
MEIKRNITCSVAMKNNHDSQLFMYEAVLVICFAFLYMLIGPGVIDTPL